MAFKAIGLCFRIRSAFSKPLRNKLRRDLSARRLISINPLGERHVEQKTGKGSVFLNWVIDFIVLVLIVIIIFAGYKKGFLRSILSLGGFLIATVFSFMFGRMIAEGVFDSMVKPWLTSMVETQVVAGTNQSLAAAVDNMYQNLPGYLSGPLDFLFGSKEQVMANIQSAMTENSATMTDSIVGLLKPMMVVLISILTVLILFLLCMFALRIIDKMLIQVRRIPVIGTFDGLLGGVVGVFQAILWMVVLVFLVKAVILLSSNGITWLNDKVVDSTILFKWLYNFDVTKVFEGINL